MWQLREKRQRERYVSKQRHRRNSRDDSAYIDYFAYLGFSRCTFPRMTFSPDSPLLLPCSSFVFLREFIFFTTAAELQVEREKEGEPRARGRRVVRASKREREERRKGRRRVTHAEFSHNLSMRTIYLRNRATWQCASLNGLNILIAPFTTREDNSRCFRGVGTWRILTWPENALARSRREYDVTDRAAVAIYCYLSLLRFEAAHNVR